MAYTGFPPSPTGRVEGVRHAAPDVVDRCLHRPTPSKHPYRPFAAAEAAADRHRVASTATRLPRGYYEATTRATTRLLRGYYAATTWLLQATTRPLPGHYQATTRLPRDYYQEPPARHSASSTAAAAPLACRRRSRQQLGAHADDPAHQRKYLEEAVLHMPNKLDNSEDQARL